VQTFNNHWQNSGFLPDQSNGQSAAIWLLSNNSCNVYETDFPGGVGVEHWVVDNSGNNSNKINKGRKPRDVDSGAKASQIMMKLMTARMNGARAKVVKNHKRR
jgi:hypothetical protein